MSCPGKPHTQRAVFLDRDGTIIEDSGYPYTREDIKFLPNAGKAIRQLNEQGFKVIVVTNQAGVARGYFTEDDVREANHYIQECLAIECARVDRVYYCPHHIEGIIAEYSKACNCRKPNPGMLEQAARDCNINLAESFIIGDHLSDVESGRRAGCRTVLLSKVRPTNITDVVPDHVASDLPEAVEWLISLPMLKRNE